jgi:hypothetical protein
MKHAIAIARARLKNVGTPSKKPLQSGEVELEISRIGLGALLLSGGIIGLGGLLTLVFGLLNANGPIRLFFNWIHSAFF